MIKLEVDVSLVEFELNSIIVTMYIALIIFNEVNFG